MNILYFGIVGSGDYYNKYIQNQGKPYNIAQYSLEKSLVEGFLENGMENIKINTIPQYEYFKSPKIFFNNKNDVYNNVNINYIPLLNIPILKEIVFFLSSFFITLIWGIKYRKSKDNIVFSAFNYVPIALGIKFASLFFDCRRVILYCDLFQDISTDKIGIKKKLLGMYSKIVKYLDNSYDYYVLVTEYMNNCVNLKNKPYIVIEGIFNNDELNFSKVKKEKAIMYSGTLNKKYGIENIITMINLLQMDVNLWLFGNGDFLNEIQENSLRDNRIIYKGFLNRQSLFEELKKATILINLRNKDDEYTKYSFPSKLFEYLASGTPVLTTKLEGIPDEYDKYLNYVDNACEASMWIEKFFGSLEFRKETEEKAEKGKEFVLRNKIPYYQVKKIIELICEENNEKNSK